MIMRMLFFYTALLIRIYILNRMFSYKIKFIHPYLFCNFHFFLTKWGNRATEKGKYPQKTFQNLFVSNLFCWYVNWIGLIKIKQNYMGRNICLKNFFEKFLVVVYILLPNALIWLIARKIVTHAKPTFAMIRASDCKHA